MQMAVEPALAGQGVGRTLVEAVFTEAARADCASVVLHARETAAGFYARCGCAVEGDPFTEVGLPHRRMRWHPPASRAASS
jgi:predicted GNAT family N-acyltransferase